MASETGTRWAGRAGHFLMMEADAIREMAGRLNGSFDRAVDLLLDLFKLDREWNEGAAKAQLITIFGALKPQDPIALAGRRRLSSMIFA